MARIVLLMSFVFANFSSFSCKPSSSLRKTTKLLSFLLSVCLLRPLTKLVKPSLVSRAKTMATGLPPYCQTKQFFLPALAPVQLSGWNGPGMLVPACGPDLRASPATTPATASAVSTHAPAKRRTFITFLLGTVDREPPVDQGMV